MNYTTVTFNLGICKIALLSAAVSQPQTQNLKQKIEPEGFNSRIRLKKTMPEDEIQYKPLQGLCDNPLRAISLFYFFIFICGGGRDGESYIFTAL